ncbi:CorA family divalent cation transporter [Thalassotalea ponticola]|uniref:CorA family divalent cation transporter n=1 Tax=Thalassotalea ponticola TaxID=1523392 RepID=UPI0025B4ED6E|nr:CorA family divalent cation transporter [Thalassotalea ponticola]MDN3653243.1 CorA family divalent cation transporter [Thalassotalea ponticola]
MSTFITTSWMVGGEQSHRVELNSAQAKTCDWVHADRSAPEFANWLSERGFSDSVIESVVANDTRPRFQMICDDSFVLNLRGVNLNQGKTPDDMLTIRFIYTPKQLISCSVQNSKAIDAVIAQLEVGRGPQDIEHLLLEIINQLNIRIDAFLTDVETFIDHIDDNGLDHRDSIALNEMQQKLLRLNRFLKPQAYALTAFTKVELNSFSNLLVNRANQLDFLSRLVETIDFYLAQIEVLNRHIEQINAALMNRNTYLLSIIAAIFLPLGFLTGLFGINIGGMPGVEHGQAFYIFSGILLLLCIIQLYVFKRLKFL